jgi:hypothetical protein
MIHRFYAAYGALVLLLFAAANHQGYVIGNLFAASHHHRPGESHYHK